MNNNQKRSLTPYEKNQLLRYGVDLEKLVETNSPVEYITGHVDFCDLNFLVNENVLIPRIETEELVELAVGEIEKIHQARQIDEAGKDRGSNSNKKLQIIDVGTGSGAIAISVAKKLGEIESNKAKIPSEILGLDISKNALSVARENLKRIDVGRKLPVKFIQSNLLSELDPNKKIDLIIANLPYVPSKRIKKLDESVKDFEPHLALDGGKDGLNLVRKLLKQAKNILSKNGAILLELDITHDKEKAKKFSDDWKIKVIKSEFGGVYFWMLELA